MENLGIFFIMYQYQLNGYVKCWIDGSEDYELLSEEDFFDMVKKTENIGLIERMKNYMHTTSIYLWDVKNLSIKRLSPTTDTSKISQMITEAKNNYRKSSNILNFLSGIFYDEKKGSIHLNK